MQSRRLSFIEAKANAILGLIVSWVFTFYGLPLLGIEPSAAQATWITLAYFFMSVMRSYAIRRIFERFQND